MKDKDEIKELFQKELGDYQAKVDPSLWNGIQAGLGSTAASTGVVSSLGLTGKIIIAVSVATAITVGIVLIVNTNKNKEENTTTELTINDLTTQDANETTNIKSKNIKNTPLDDVDEDIATVDIKEINLNKEQENGNNDFDLEVESTKDLRNSNGAYKEDASNDKNLENIIVSQKKTKVEPSEEFNTKRNNKEEKEEIVKIDLSKVNIEIVMQNNQYVNFSAVGVPTNTQITWDLGDGNYERNLNPEHFYAEAGIYNVVLKVQSGTEEITKNIKVEIQLKGKIGDLPNVFTPNGDGRNDIFFIECKHLKTFQLTIMDNNQNVIFSTNDSNFRWNGFDKNGTPVKEGNYVYMIVAEDDAGNVINKYQRLNIQR